MNGTLFFRAFDGTNGDELWQSDGTSAGTTLVADIRSGTGSSFPRSLTNVNGTLFFSATDGTNGSELWSMPVNSRPRLTAFAAAVGSTTVDTEVELTFAEFLAQGDESDADGTVDAFIVQTVASGTLKIGTSAGSATAFAVGTNDRIDATLNAYWTPDANVSGNAIAALTVLAQDNIGDNSNLPVTATVTVTDVNEGAVLDVDGSGGNAAAQSDGLLVFAALSGVSDTTQLASLMAANASLTTSEVLARVNELRGSLVVDVDGNGVVSAQSDGLLIFAILSGVTDPTQLSGLIAPDAPRTVPQIIAAVQALRSPSGVAAASSPAAEASVLAVSAATDDQPQLFTETPDVSVPVPVATAVAERNHSAGARRVSWPKSTRFDASDAVTSAAILSDDQSPFPDLETLDGLFHSLLKDNDFLLFG